MKPTINNNEYKLGSNYLFSLFNERPWMMGVLDGCGTFIIFKNAKGYWQLELKCMLNLTDENILIFNYLKRNFNNAGSIKIIKDRLIYRITDKQQLLETLIPYLNKLEWYPKNKKNLFYFITFKKILLILNDVTLSYQDKDNKISFLYLELPKLLTSNSFFFNDQEILFDPVVDINWFYGFWAGAGIAKIIPPSSPSLGGLYKPYIRFHVKNEINVPLLIKIKNLFFLNKDFPVIKDQFDNFFIETSSFSDFYSFYSKAWPHADFFSKNLWHINWYLYYLNKVSSSSKVKTKLYKEYLFHTSSSS